MEFNRFALHSLRANYLKNDCCRTYVGRLLGVGVEKARREILSPHQIFNDLKIDYSSLP